MGDLTSTHCGCQHEHNNCCSIIWIILILSCVCGNGSSLFGGSGCDDDCGNNFCWIIILLLFCGNNHGCSIF